MERRTRRSNQIHKSLSNFLDALCLKRNLDAVALTTHDGLLIAGKGKVDLEEIGAIGAALARRQRGGDGRGCLAVAGGDPGDAAQQAVGQAGHGILLVDHERPPAQPRGKSTRAADEAAEAHDHGAAHV